MSHQKPASRHHTDKPQPLDLKSLNHDLLGFRPRAVVGRRELIELPELHLHLNAKIDTGAHSSALHAESIEVFEQNDELCVRFITRTGGSDSPPHTVETQVHDRRRVRSSNGQAQWRYVIRSRMRLAGLDYDIDMTLVDRSQMRHPILLGRRALRRLLVAPGAAYLHGEP
ncbi:ATP-dependent zinc protease [Cobetia crustatorum]|uniref:ATP-dependent zinc protease n=1 Tax=Cobetia crustatorum TaxID=553385 RepID=A0A558HWV7_9GAMM|nr:RimK/LysX family protein [Cobetia crustatorum]TVU73579.1 ATP-dependent zinc protease [Cobetia crustatorum]